MTLKEFVGVDSYLRDKRTNEHIEWNEYMSRIIGKLGKENIKPYIPFDISYLREMYKKDEYLNNTYLSCWDDAANCITYLLIRNGITIMSLSEKVCILKETAIMFIKEE